MRTILACGIVALAVGAAAVAAEPAPKPRIVYALSGAEVALRSGERVRPRVIVECDERDPRIRFDLNAYGPAPKAGPAALAGRIIVLAARGDSSVERITTRIAWPPGERPWTWAIPESSAWSDSLAGASALRLEPDSTGPVAEPVVFRFDAIRPWTDARERCRQVPTPPLPPEHRAPPAADPEFGEYVYVEEFPEAIEIPKCPPPVDARGEKIVGNVVVQAHVSAEGRVDGWKIVKSAPGLDEAAIECVRHYRFRPGRSGGRPVAVWVAIPLRYTGE